jgi:hypothetical protein
VCIVPSADAFDDLIRRLKKSQGGKLIVEQGMDGAFV